VGDIRSTLDANINGLTVGKGGGSVANNTVFGSGALAANTTGDFNVAIGVSALAANTTSIASVGVGALALQKNTTGVNTAIGGSALNNVTTGTENTAVGRSALQTLNATISGNTAVGHLAANATTTGTQIVSVGAYSLNANTTGKNSTSIGYGSLGDQSTGNGNTAIGFRAGRGVTTGTYNTFVGTISSDETTASGITTGSFNTIIGSQITGLSSSLANTIILADGQGNQRLYIDNNGRAYFGNGVSSATPTTGVIEATDGSGTNIAGAELRLQGGQGTGTGVGGALTFYTASAGTTGTSTNAAVERMRITTTGDIGFGTNSPSTYLAGLNGNVLFKNGSPVGQTMAINATNYVLNYINSSANYIWYAIPFGDRAATLFNSTGNWLFGTGSTDAGYKLDVNGTTRISGTELRLDNGTTGTLNIYSNTPTINFFSGGGYTFGRSGTTMNLNSAGSINMQIGGNDAYAISSANGHIWRSAISGGAALARLTTSGNMIIGSTTDGGQRLQVVGTLALVSGANYALMQPLTDRVYFPNTVGIVAFGIQSPNNAQQSFRDNFTTGIQLISSAIGDGVQIGYKFNVVPNSGTWASGNKIVNFQANGTTYGVIDWDGGGHFGVASPVASSILSATSTTKGFLPPRMTTTQKNAITSPAAGLVVYDTTLSKLCVYTTAWETITSV
jgi:hypothetical protein